MEPLTEGEADSDQTGGHSYSEAALRLTIARLLWIYSFTAGIVALFFCIYLGIRMIIMWKVAMYTRALSPFELSLLIGTDMGLLTVVVCLVFLVPRMIMTWITALVFEFIFDRKLQHRRAVVENGKKLGTRDLHHHNSKCFERWGGRCHGGCGGNTCWFNPYQISCRRFNRYFCVSMVNVVKNFFCVYDDGVSIPCLGRFVHGKCDE
eukprot:c25389_g1_i4 orf=726-1346(-)